MKKQFLVLLTLIIAVGVYAQKEGVAPVEPLQQNQETVMPQGGDNISPKLIDDLALTPDQKQKLRESFLKHQKQKIQLKSEKAQLELDLQNVFAVSPLNKAEASRIGEKIGETEKKMTQLKVESWGQFLSNLTPAQHQKAMEFQAKHREARREMKMEMKEEMRKEKQERREKREEKREETKERHHRKNRP